MSSAEFTTQIGCPVACLKYCPQEVITKNYQGVKTLTLENFKSFLSQIPKTETIIFSGVSEPFTNPKCIDMIEHANSEGYKIWLFTTLVGVGYMEASRLLRVPIDRVCLHLPDAKQNARIPITTEYKDVLAAILESVENLEFMNMGGLFQTCKSEDFIRGNVYGNKVGKIWCRFLESPQYLIMPNGDVYVCPTTTRFATRGFGVDQVIGNLHIESYRTIMEKFAHIKYELEWNPFSICHRCPGSENWIKHKIVSTRL